MCLNRVAAFAVSLVSCEARRLGIEYERARGNPRLLERKGYDFIGFCF